MRKLLAVAVILTSLAAAAQNKPAAATNGPSRPKAVFDTTMGRITCTLFPDKAPLTVDNFIGLATGTKEWINPVSKGKKRNTPLYDGTIFHRVIPGFMIQGGDPAGNGAGDPGFSFRDEITDLRFDQPGRLAMANSGPNTNGSQFFITEVPTVHLNGRHTIFGQCNNLELVKKIARVPRNMADDKPFKPVRITKLTIVKPGQAMPGGGASQAKPASPAVKKPGAAAAKAATGEPKKP